MRRRPEQAPLLAAPPGQPAARPFDAIAATLREEVLAHCERNGVELEGRAGWNTLETNSGFAERRGEPLVRMAAGRLGVRSLAGLRVADLGCGFGALSTFFASQGAEVCGIDVNRRRLEVGRRVAERHGLDIELHKQSMEAPALPEESFDLVVMNNSLCYLAEPGGQLRALRAARALLVPGGAIVTRNPNRMHPVDQFSGIPLLTLLGPAAAVRVADRLGRRRSYCRLTSPRTAGRELLEAGFVGVIHHPSAQRSWIRPSLFARYSHFSALRPGRQPGGR
jgi:2-polyprenyl-3-methyl-5-hydroxy-6-metoxy-1,4-benzoquinol methylase